MTEKFFIGKPDLDTARPQMREGLGGQKPQAVITYEDAMGYSMIWSAAFGLPAVGETVFVTMNDIGYAVVAGYFVSILDDGTAYLGIMEKTLCPPEWMVDQRKRNPGKTDWQRAGIGCIFGTECRPLAAGEVVPSVAELQAERRKKAAAWKRKVAKQRKAERAEQEARWAAARAAQALDRDPAPEVTPETDWFGRELPSGE